MRHMKFWQGLRHKRSIAVLTIIMMILQLLPAAAFAEEVEVTGGEPAQEITIDVITVDTTEPPVESAETTVTAFSLVSEDNIDLQSDENESVGSGNEESNLETQAATEDVDVLEDSDEADDENQDENASEDEDTSDSDEEWDITKTERPSASEDVTANTGTSDDKVNSSEGTEDKNWDIFYDADNDVYKITFNIGSGTDAATQTIDLTQALELLGQYAESGKAELEAAIDALEKPVMGDAGEKPTAPGVPENLDSNLDAAYDEILANVPRDSEGEPGEDFDYASIIAEKTGLDKDDPFVKESASHMYDQAMVDWVMDSWDKWEAEGHMYANYFEDPDTMLYYGCGIAVNWPEGYNKGTPVLKQPAPEFEVDTTSEAYKAYLKEMDAYNAKLDEIEAKYAKDEAAYKQAVAELKNDFDRRIGANVLEPGDAKKFELYLTSDSKHTYKYQSGSFTLATPGWGEQTSGIKGFDGQILPDKYIDRAEYHVTLRCEPIQEMLEGLGMDAYDRFNGYPSYWNNDIKAFLSKYDGETVADQLNAYLLDYYNSKDGTSYTTVDELVKNNSDAKTELTKTETSGNKWFRIDGQNFVVDAHLETVQYDTFYQQLFSFAFGNEADINEILGSAKFNEETNRWEYENDSWTDNGYKNALYYYMDHKEIWQQTDAYFQALLDSGLSAEKATWTSLMMALNIDGELTGNDWQNTAWPWYSSIQLERMDIDFNLSKKDGETGETITSSETEFQVYYIDKVTQEDGTVSNVNMYCTYDETTNSYTFVTTPSTVWTQSGELNIDYAMMKDIVYYLQEVTAPEGYERDTNVYIVMNEDDYNKLSDEDKAALEGTFDKFLDLDKSEDGLTVSTDFVNVQIVVTPDDPTPTPDPGDGPDPDPEEPPTYTPPTTPTTPTTPETTVPEPEVPLADLPEVDVPLADVPEETEEPLMELPEDEVPLADVPKTGDASFGWLAALLLSGLGLLKFGSKKCGEEK